jgi:hypothetical protein
MSTPPVVISWFKQSVSKAWLLLGAHVTHAIRVVAGNCPTYIVFENITASHTMEVLANTDFTIISESSGSITSRLKVMYLTKGYALVLRGAR